MRQIRVSVIMTTYNHEPYIEQAICSVLQQKTNHTFELLIGEDCSTDKTLSICNRYATDYPDQIKLFASSSNRGLIINYFGLLETACGDYIMDCSGDDYWIDPHKLQNQVDMLDANPSIVAVHSDWQELDMTSGVIVHRARKNPYGIAPITSGRELLFPRLYMVDKVAIHLSTTCFRRHPFMEYYYKHHALFHAQQTPCEDLPITVVLCSLGDIAFQEKATICYRITGHSITSTPDQYKLFTFWHNRTELTHQLDLLFGGTVQWRQYCFSRLFYAQLMFLFRSGLKKHLPLVIEQARKVNYRFSLKEKIIITTINNPLLLQVGHVARDIFVGLKKAFR